MVTEGLNAEPDNTTNAVVWQELSPYNKQDLYNSAPILLVVAEGRTMTMPDLDIGSDAKDALRLYIIELQSEY